MTRTSDSIGARASLALVLPLLAALALGAPRAAIAQEVTGTWETRAHEGDRHPERIYLQLRVEPRGDGDWQMGFSIDADELVGVSDAQLRGSADAVQFELRREAGTVSFDGEIRDGRGMGWFTFAASPAYVDRMAELGYPDLSDDRLFGFAIQDVTTAYVVELQSLGYRDLSEDDLWRFAIHGVTTAFISGMNGLGYANIEPDDLVRLRIHGVSLEYVRQVRAALGGR